MTSSEPARDPARPTGATTRAADRSGRRSARVYTLPSARRRLTTSHPSAVRLAIVLVRAADEVAAGRRPLAQLEPLLAPTLLRRLSVQVRRRPDGGAQPVAIRRVIAAPPTPTGAVEVTVLTERAGRVTAVAVRVERHHGRWRATELTAPESGFAPLPTRSDPRARREPDAFDDAAVDAAVVEVTRRRGSA